MRSGLSRSRTRFEQAVEPEALDLRECRVKNSVAGLLSFSAGAYGFERGITSPPQLPEDTSLRRPAAAFDPAADLEDTGGPLGFREDVEASARFMH